MPLYKSTLKKIENNVAFFDCGDNEEDMEVGIYDDSKLKSQHSALTTTIHSVRPLWGVFLTTQFTFVHLFAFHTLIITREHIICINTAHMITIGINGFGRIGRLAFRIAVSKHLDEIKIGAINTSGSMPASGWAHLVNYDTMYREYQYKVQSTECFCL